MKKLVGVITFYNEERQRGWLIHYLRLLKAAGAVPLVLPLTGEKLLIDSFFEVCGGFLLMGGQDVSPSVYGCEKMPWCGECLEPRDEMETYVLGKALELDRPVLGVCRGIQIINACLGGTLYQDLREETKTALVHSMEPPFDREAHKVSIDRESPFFSIFGEDRISVNSLHHQGIKELAPDLKAWAWADDGLIEGVYLPSKKFFAAVQWHPELLGAENEYSMKLVRNFIASIEQDKI